MSGMKLRSLLAASLLAAGALGCAYPGRVPAADPPAAAAGAAGGVDFATQVRPILEARCQPCHFPGGKMYARLPFDRAETILTLREKLFTRIKDEDEQRLLREFLAQHPADAAVAGERPAGS
jgi:hypothetical protein